MGWILGGFFALILLITLVFYLGRGVIMKKALVYLNENQPGEVHMGQMNLIPLMDFPAAVVQLKDVSWYEKPVRSDSLHQEPILYLHELYVSLDIVELIRGDIRVEQFRLEDGFVRIEVYADSLMNLEKALGMRFGDEPGEEPEDAGSADSTRTIDMEKIEMKNILALYHDLTTGDEVNIQVNHLESQFSYLPEIISAGIELNIDINKIKYQTIKVESKSDIRFNSHIQFNPESKSVEIKPSALSIAGLELETWGMYEFLDEPGISMAFRATNTGLDVLNFLFLGVLDLDEIEQIGSGSIHLDGSVTGSLGEQLPVIRVNGKAQGLGFRIKSIQRDIKDISFALYATNGAEADFSEGLIELKGFSATYPEGTLHGDIRATNLVTPEIDLELRGELDLTGLERMIELEKLEKLEGHVRLDCSLGGVIDRTTGEFLDEAGSVTVSMENAGLIYGKDTLSELYGTVFMDGDLIGARGLGLTWNGSSAEIEVKVENILHYLLDYERDVNIEMALASNRILPGRLTSDTVIVGLLGEELNRLHFKADASISNDELDAFLDHDTLPEFNFKLDSFGIGLGVYADISDVSASLTFDTDTLSLHYLNGNIGSSGFSFSGKVVNLEALMNSDSGEMVGFDYKLTSPMMKAEDLLIYKSRFLLPESYRTEYLEDFHLEGSAYFPVEGIVYDSVDQDFGVDITDMGWHFRYYPMAIDSFRIRAQKEGDKLLIDNLEGNIGESNLKLSALIGNYADSSLENLYGNLELHSDLLDFDKLLNYQLPIELKESPLPDSAVSLASAVSSESPVSIVSASSASSVSATSATSAVSLASAVSSDSEEPQRLDQMEFPNFNLNLDIGELRFSGNSLYDIKGAFRSSIDKIFYIDSLDVSGESGGGVELSGAFILTDPLYKLSMQMQMKEFNINDLNFAMGTGEETYSLK
ncbi:MAG: hypothetical protein GY790_03680, partial [Bacteroidetes bacterium]|nr:hypothetical protein [Bacteroidota bacterium]